MWYRPLDHVDFDEALLLQLHMSYAKLLGICTALTVKYCCKISDVLMLSGFHCATSSKH